MSRNAFAQCERDYNEVLERREQAASDRMHNIPARKLPLERRSFAAKHGFPWTSCLPFVENSRGTLIHRPRSGATYNIHRTGPHIAVEFWCGMHVSSSGKNLTFLSVPPDCRILCERCEIIAVANALPSADELAGKHVHKGRTIAVASCC